MIIGIKRQMKLGGKRREISGVESHDESGIGGKKKKRKLAG